MAQFPIKPNENRFGFKGGRHTGVNHVFAFIIAVLLQASGDILMIRPSFQGVTSGLATAFETTLIGPVFALILQLWITFTQKREISFLAKCNDYCHSHKVSKLRLIDRTPATLASAAPEAKP